MMNGRNMRASLAWVALLAGAAIAPAQEAGTLPAGQPRPWRHEASDLKPDSRVQWKTFEGGLRLAWAVNAEPQERIYLRLHVDVGSLAELPGERGMAHFLEHMAFNGSRHFPAGTLVEWFQNHGMSFGADTNAHTGFTETVYKLDLPNRDPASLREGLQVLRDFADGLILAEEEVQAEKGVIDGEERERDSAGFRAFVASLGKLYAGSLMPERLPIGTRADRDAFDAAKVRAFYRRWYRPENMTLVIVGDLRELNPEALVREVFADMKGPGTEVQIEPAAGAATAAEFFFAVHEPDLPQMQVNHSALRPFVERLDGAELRRERTLEDLALAMVNLRFNEQAKQEGTPFLYAGVARLDGLRVWEGAELTVVSAAETWEEAFLAAHLELRTALNFGFQDAELAEVRADVLRALDEAVEREPTAPSAGLREALLMSVEEGSVATSAATEREVLLELVTKATPQQCLQALRALWSRDSQDALAAVGPADLGAKAPERLAALLEQSRKAKLARPADLAQAPFAYPSDPATAGAVAKSEWIEDLELRTVLFANGVRLNFKRTDFKERQILLSARVGEGMLGFADEELIRVGVAANGLNGAGLEAHSEEELRRILAGRRVGWASGLDTDHFSFAGDCTAEDLLLELELFAAHVQHPGWREEGLQPFLKQLPLIEQFLRSNHLGPLLAEFLPVYFAGNQRLSAFDNLSALPPLEEMAQVTMAGARPLISPQYAEGPIELTIVGDVDEEAVLSAAARTVGVLPPRRAAEEQAARRAVPELPLGLEMEREIDSADSRAQVFLFYPLTDGLDPVRRRQQAFLGMVVDDRLRLEVRERLGAAYSPAAMADLSRVFPGFGLLMINASSDPDKVDVLVAACRQVAAELAEKGVTEEEMTRLRGPVLNQVRDQRRTNEYWLRELAQAQSDPHSLENPRTVLSFYENLDRAALNALAAKFLKPERSSVLVVKPR
jgi:zinc protease